MSGVITGPQTTNLQSGGNGSGYDGKLYIHLASELCTDGKAFDSAIETRSKQNVLVRENCQDLKPTDQIAVEVEIESSSPWILRYQDRFYVEKLILLGATQSNASKDLISSGTLWNIDSGRLKQDGSYFARFNSKGETLWSKSHPWISEAADQVLLLSNGDSLLAASFKPSGSTVFSVWLVRMNRSGALVWSKRLFNSERSVAITSLAEENSGSVWLGGYLGEADSPQAILMKISSEGAALSVRSLGAGTYIDTVLASVTGDIYFSGRASGDSFVAKLNSNDELSWNHIFKTYKRIIMNVTDGGHVVLQAYFSAMPEGIPVVLPNLRLHSLDPAGALLKSLKFDSQNWDNVFPGYFLKGPNQTMWMGRRAGTSDDLQILKFNDDLSAVSGQVLPIDKNLKTARLIQDGGGFSVRSSILGLPPYGTDVLTWIDPEACSTCQALVVPELVPAAPPTLELGPALTVTPDVLIEEATFTSWTEAVVFLPLLSF